MTLEQLHRSSRFEVVRRVGAGGMGVVYEARHRSTGDRVALKTLHRLDAHALYRLKREFRVLQEIAHENLIRFHELVEEAGLWFVVMEFIEGTDLVTYVRGVPAVGEASTLEHPHGDADLSARTMPAAGPAPIDYARARVVVEQIAGALESLHDAGCVHRDLKPSNVIVDRYGRVVVLDFGLAFDARVADSSEHAMVGTIPYMAPEQVHGGAVGPAADCYALGVVLHELLTGRWPFDGTAIEIATGKLTTHARAPRLLVPELPEDLDDLCATLLAIDPGARPSALQVRQRMSSRIERGNGSMSRKRSGGGFLVGRDSELGELHQALAASRDRAQVVWVRGQSGIGKSSLLARFADEARAADPTAIVLTARCHEQESVPFKAFDAIVDGASSLLRRLRDEETAAVLPRHASALAAAFPVLSRVNAFAQAPRPARPPADPHEQRALAFGALRELFARISDRSPLAILIDDFQWGDLDSVRLLNYVLRSPDAPAALVVVATRDDTASHDFARQVDAIETGARAIAIGPLSPRAAAELIGHFADEAGIPTDVARDSIAAAAGHHPLHIEELLLHAVRDGGRRTTVRLEDAIAARVARLDERRRDLLALISVAGAPISRDVLRATIDRQAADLARDLAVLTVERFVRSASIGGGGVEPFHDRVRETVVSALDAEEVRRLHGRIATALEGAADLAQRRELLVQHFLAAGEIRRARYHARIAAADAEKRLAFKRAAELYMTLLQDEQLTNDDRRELLARRAEVLKAAGLLLEAAAEYRRAAALAQGRERLALERRTVEQLLRGGDLDQGFAAAIQLLGKVGVKVPTTWRRTLVALSIERARIRLRGIDFDERAEKDVDPDLLERIDVLWSVSSGFPFVNPVLGRVLQARFLREALGAGELRRVALAFGIEIGYLSIPGVPARERCEQLLAHARGLAQRLGVPEVTGFVEANGGLASFLSGHFREAHERIREGELLMRQNPLEMQWVLDLSEIFGIATLWFLGELRELLRVHPAYLRAAEERGNVYSQRGLRGWRSNIAWLIRDDADEARAQANRATPGRSVGEPFHLHHYYDVLAFTMIDRTRCLNPVLLEAGSRRHDAGDGRRAGSPTTLAA